MYPRCFTISGLPGSGTSTASRLLARHLRYRRIDVGTLFREMADKAGIPLEEFGQMAEENHQIDQDIDASTLEIARSDEHPLVLEGRLTGWLLRSEKIECFTVWLKASEETRAVRIAQRDRVTFEAALQHLHRREASERKRYRDIYNIDIDDLSIYDLVLDSGEFTPEEIVAEILISSFPKTS